MTFRQQRVMGGQGWYKFKYLLLWIFVMFAGPGRLRVTNSSATHVSYYIIDRKTQTVKAIHNWKTFHASTKSPRQKIVNILTPTIKIKLPLYSTLLCNNFNLIHLISHHHLTPFFDVKMRKISVGSYDIQNQIIKSNSWVKVVLELFFYGSLACCFSYLHFRLHFQFTSLLLSLVFFNLLSSELINISSWKTILTYSSQEVFISL